MAKQGGNRVYHGTDLGLGARAFDPRLLGFQGQLLRKVQSHHEDWGLWGLVNDLFRGFQAIHFGHLEVEYDQIVMTAFKSLDRLQAVARLVTHPPVVLLFEETAQVAAHRRVVIR